VTGVLDTTEALVHSPCDRHHLERKGPTETEAGTSSREPEGYFLLKVK
jgi:hypothetical protein